MNVKEKEIDEVIEGLIGLKDGMENAETLLLSRAVAFLKRYRGERARWRKVAAGLKSAQELGDKLAGLKEIREDLFGRKKKDAESK
jgi:hypothetical protein